MTSQMETADAAEHVDDAPVEAEDGTGSKDGTGSEDGTGSKDGTGSSRRWQILLLVVALLIAVSGSFMWWLSAQDADRAAAQTRDDVLIQARQAIQTMNTLDYRSVDDGVKAWSQVTTGAFRDSLTGVKAEDRKLLAEQKKISTGRVVDAAVVDVDGNSATVIAAVEVTVQDDATPGSEPTVKRNRFSADLIRVGDGWKLESLQQVAVSLS